MLSVREVIVVEGKYDRLRLQSVVRATIMETNGFRIFKDPEHRELLRRLGMERGLLVLTDSDAAGFVIRNHLNGLLPPDRIKHAYIPAIHGKEKRKTAASREELLGVEGMDATVLEKAIHQAGATLLDGESDPQIGGITKADFYQDGLTGSPDSGERRRQLLELLGFPLYLSTNRLLEAVNALMTREEYRELVERIR